MKDTEERRVEGDQLNIDDAYLMCMLDVIRIVVFI